MENSKLKEIRASSVTVEVTDAATGVTCSAGRCP